MRCMNVAISMLASVAMEKAEFIQTCMAECIIGSGLTRLEGKNQTQDI